jgi:hypothetical protein
MVCKYLFSLHLQTLQHLVKMDFQNGLLALLAEGQMPQQDR